MTRASALHRFAGDLLGRPLLLAAGVVLVAVAALSLGAPLLAAWLGHDPEAVDLMGRFARPDADHPLGRDELGRDLALRLAYGGQVSLAVGLAGALAAALIGTIVGLVAGTTGGWLDALLMRVTDAVIALPVLPLLIVLSAVDPAELGPLSGLFARGPGDVARIVVLVALVGWTTTARLVRAQALSVRTHDFVRAAEALGASPLRIMVRHILPSCASPIVVATTLAVGSVILTESVLSFLGLGIQPPTPSWGNMLTNAQELVWAAPRLAILPGLAIFVTVVCVNVLGDGLQDVLDPRGRD
jgi:peptide/nickel transport system permease protein